MLVSISTRCYIHNIVYTTQLSCVPLLGHTSPLFSREFLYLFSPLLETSSPILSSSKAFFLMSKIFMLHTNPNSFTPIISHYCTFMVRSTLTFPELARSILLRILFICLYTSSHNSLIQIRSFKILQLLHLLYLCVALVHSDPFLSTPHSWVSIHALSMRILIHMLQYIIRHHSQLSRTYSYGIPYSITQCVFLDTPL